MKLISKIAAVLLLTLSGTGCNEVAVPKPKGYFRIDFPAKKYLTLDQHSHNLPFSFEYPAYGQLNFDSQAPEKEGWFNIEFPSYKAIIYLTYKPVKNDFGELMEQTYRMNVKNHIARADAINEQAFNNKERNVYAVLYDLKGNTATAVQFYATDSTNHYLRGSLYFDAVPEADSLQPVIDFFREDIIHMVETLDWNQ